MRKAILGFLAVALFAAICWAGGDPWKDKPYAQWDDKDIQHVLSNSPWVRNVTVSAAWEPASSESGGMGGYGNTGQTQPNPPAQQSSPSGGGGGMKGGGGPGGGPGGAPQSSSGMDMPSIPQATFSVFWLSSRTMREALGRRAVLHSGRSEADVDKYVDQPLEDFEVTVQGRDMTPFSKNDEAFFQSHATLEMKKSKDKVAPVKVTLEHSQNGNAVTAATFYFPKKSSTGEATIAADEKEVTFACEIGKTQLKVSFDPRKMSDQKGPDL
ncbi:MAG TPA: hypothetical protein VJR23_04405 [Candidatus Acidoferrales bacterium]|nr:hypothetical protein [Candidatus Acidoferrales bacterium]